MPFIHRWQICHRCIKMYKGDKSREWVRSLSQRQCDCAEACRLRAPGTAPRAKKRDGHDSVACHAHCIFECMRADFTRDESIEPSATTSRLATLGDGGRARVQCDPGADRRDSGNGQSGFGCDAGYGSLPPSHCAARRAFEGSEAFAYHQLPLLRQRRSVPMRLHFSGRAAGHCPRSWPFGSADPGRKWAHATTRRQGSKPSASPPDLLIWQHRCPGQPI